MIKINLLPQKRGRRGAQVQAPGPGGRGAMMAQTGPASGQLYLAIGALVLVAGVVFLGFDRPKRSKLSALKEKNADTTAEIQKTRKEMAGSNGEASCDELKAKEDDAKQRAEGINRLMATKAVPANVLHELGEILKPNHLPTMTEDWAKKVGNGGDPNKKLDLTWDPSHIWLTGYTDKDGTVTIEGGAQADSDVTQLAKRLDASAYFSNVAQAGGERTVDRDSGMPYVKFTITGKVAY